MLENIRVFSAAAGLSRHAAHQQAVVSDNLANIDTPGFRSKIVSKFELAEGVPALATSLQRTRHTHFSGLMEKKRMIASEDKSTELKPNGNSVSLEAETLKSIEAERIHSRAMAVYQASLNILRSSMGRGR